MAQETNNRTGYEEVTGQTPSISEWVDFEFYDLVWWLDQPNKPDFMENTRQLAQWLGVSHQVGSNLSYWLITESSKIISKTSVEHVTQDNYLQVEIKVEIDWFNRCIKESLDDANFVVDGEGEFNNMYLENIDDENHLGIWHANDLNTPTATEYDLNTPTAMEYDDIHTDDRPNDDDDEEEAIDKYLNVELIMGIGTNDE